MSPVHFLKTRRALHRRLRHEIRGLPGLVLLLQVALAGGHSPRRVLSTIDRFASLSGPIGVASSAISTVTNRLALGANFTEALLAAEHAGDLSPSSYRVLDALRRSELDGEPLSTQLDILVVELRTQRANALDVAAQRLTVALLFPLVVCILPAFIVLAVVPLVITALATLPS